MITSDQIRAARALLRWSGKDLAKNSGVSLPTIQRIEAANGPPSALGTNIAAIQNALELGGVIFIDQNGEGPGVRFKKNTSE